jgi:hypothetical protein
VAHCRGTDGSSIAAAARESRGGSERSAAGSSAQRVTVNAARSTPPARSSTLLAVGRAPLPDSKLTAVPGWKPKPWIVSPALVPRRAELGEIDCTVEQAPLSSTTVTLLGLRTLIRAHARCHVSCAFAARSRAW